MPSHSEKVTFQEHFILNFLLVFAVISFRISKVGSHIRGEFLGLALVLPMLLLFTVDYKNGITNVQNGCVWSDDCFIGPNILLAQVSAHSYLDSVQTNLSGLLEDMCSSVCIFTWM